MNRVTLRNGTALPVTELTVKDLHDIKQLQTTVISSLAEKTFLQPLTDEEFIDILTGNGLLMGVRSEGQLVAFRAMLDPGEDPEHLGTDAGIPKDQLSSVLYSEITNVHPHFQGNGLQRQLGKIVMDRVDRDRYRYVCTTVAPFNIASLKDKFELGMQIAALHVKYGTLTRYIMIKDLASVIQVSDESVIEVSMADIEQQQEYLQAGWIGTRMEPCENGWNVIYQKRIS